MTRLLFALLLSVSAVGGQASEKLKPFILVGNTSGDMGVVLGDIRQKLQQADFSVLGEVSPYAGTTIVVVTNDKLRRAATVSLGGTYAMAQRISLTRVGQEIQLAYTNPVYMAHAYRMPESLAEVGAALAQALGKGEPYGSAEGLSAEELREYHYMFAMPYFDDPYEIAEFDSHTAALRAVEEGLAAGRGGVSKVYRADVAGRERVLFGVHLTRECSGDEYIMSRIDFKELRSSGHLPYELLVDGKAVYALHAKFRIAINFPDLKMAGDNSFMSIMCAPDAIEEALEDVTGS